MKKFKLYSIVDGKINERVVEVPGLADIYLHPEVYGELIEIAEITEA